jgi:hypothetical protein
MSRRLEWEVIEHVTHTSADIPPEYQGEEQYHSYHTIKRCKVYGGWLIKSESGAFGRDSNGRSSGLGEALTFIPDPNWEWTL